MKTYSEAATEVLEILNNMNPEDINKIPKKFINFLEENCSKIYKPNFDLKKPIDELNLDSKTQALLGIIYLKYWANEEEKMEFNKKLKKNEIKYQQEIREKYNPDKIFKKN